MFCLFCGTELPDYSKFCLNCGKATGSKIVNPSKTCYFELGSSDRFNDATIVFKTNSKETGNEFFNNLLEIAQRPDLICKSIEGSTFIVTYDTGSFVECVIKKTGDKIVQDIRKFCNDTKLLLLTSSWVLQKSSGSGGYALFTKEF